MTDRETIRTTLLQFLREDTALDVESLPGDIGLRDGISLDSVDFVGLVMRVEGQYRIRLAHPELEQIRSAGDLLDLIQCKIAIATPMAA